MIDPRPLLCLYAALEFRFTDDGYPDFSSAPFSVPGFVVNADLAIRLVPRQVTAMTHRTLEPPWLYMAGTCQ
jgi:hypothetical protein